MSSRRPVAAAVLTALVLVTVAHDAASEPSHKTAHSKKADRSRPPPAPPAPAPAPAPPTPTPVSAPSSSAADSTVTMTTTTSATTDLASAPLPPPTVVRVASSSSSRRSRYSTDDNRDADRREERDGDDSSSTGWTLFGVGTALFATAWIATGATTAAICDGNCKHSEAALAWVPLAGPLIVGAVGTPSGGQIAALTASFLVQSAGLTLMIVGLANTGSSSDRSSDRRERRSQGSGSLYVAPQIGATGMMMGGTF